MAILWFVGLGLSDERGLSERAVEILESVETVFAEEYTAVAAPGSLERLSKRIGRPVEPLGRAALEEGAPVLESLKRGSSALVVVGDPFAATTHVALRLACEKAGHDWRYLPNASILTAAAGFLGLQHYRFGRTVSLPFPDPGFAPTSMVDRIAQNREFDLHTLVLLDLRPSEGRFLSPAEALPLLRERDPRGRALPPDATVALVARVGTDTAAAWVGVPSKLETVEFGPSMYALVVLAPTLHFEEEAAIARFRVA